MTLRCEAGTKRYALTGVLLAVVLLAACGDPEPRRLGTNNIVEGDGRTEWKVGKVVFVIPDGVRLEAGPGWVAGDGEAGTPIYIVGGGGFGLSVTGVVLSRWAPTPEVDAQLDQLLESIRVLP